MGFKGVIFDFNGTMLWDTSLHNQAWDSYLEQYGIRLTDREKFLRLHGKNNRQIIRDLLGREVPEEEIARISREKELLYQEMLRSCGLQLADGLVALMEYLKDSKVSMSIVTASDRLNVEFFTRYFNLLKWFDSSRIIFNDGTMSGKPDPDMFLLAMERMGCRPSETLIFEDSENGILAAHRAQPGKLIIVDSTGNDYTHWEYEVVRSFDEVDRSIFT